jgi:hypothetical protein
MKFLFCYGIDSKQTNKHVDVTPDMLMDFEEKKSVKTKVKVFSKAFVNGENKYKWERNPQARQRILRLCEVFFSKKSNKYFGTM